MRNKVAVFDEGDGDCATDVAQRVCLKPAESLNTGYVRFHKNLAAFLFLVAHFVSDEPQNG
jgi:hypothetical protein